MDCRQRTVRAPIGVSWFLSAALMLSGHSCSTTERALVLLLDGSTPDGVSSVLVESQIDGEYGKDLTAVPDNRRIALVALPEGRQGTLTANVSWLSGGCKVSQGQASFELPTTGTFVVERHVRMEPLPQKLCPLTVTIRSGQGRILNVPDGSQLDCKSPGRTPWVCKSDVAYGSQISLTAEPDARYSKFAFDGACVSRDTPCTVTITDTAMVNARFADRFCAPNSDWCFYAPLPSAYELRAVWGNAPDNLWSVGEQSTILHFDGTAWTRSPMDKSIPSLTLRAVWGTTPTDVWAVGDQGVILHFDGSSWKQDMQGSAQASLPLNGLFGTQNGSLWAVGDLGNILHFNGSGWVKEDHGQGNGDLTAIWGSDDQHLFAVGKGAIVLERVGTTWSRSVLVGMTGTLRSVWGRSAGDVWAVGDGGLAAHKVGATGWMVDGAARTAANSLNLSAVWGDSTGTIRVSGDSGTILQLPNGGVWSKPTFGPPASTALHLYGAGGSGGTTWLAGEAGALWDITNGQLSQSPVIGRLNQLAGIKSGSSRSLWAVGNKGTILKYNGLKWDVAPNSAGASQEILNTVIAFSENDVWVGGQNQTLLHFNGSSWTPSTLPMSTAGDAVLGLWGVAANNIWAVGSGGYIAHYYMGTWTAHTKSKTLTMNADLTDIYGISSDNIWAVAAAPAPTPNVIRFGVDWTASSLPSTMTSSPTTVWVSPTGSIWIGGSGGYIRRYSVGGVEQPLPALPTDLPAATTLLSIRGQDDRDVWVTASNGEILHFDGTGWSRKAPSRMITTARAVYPQTGNDIWVVGWNSQSLREGQGAVLRYVPIQ